MELGHILAVTLASTAIALLTFFLFSTGTVSLPVTLGLWAFVQGLTIMVTFVLHDLPHENKAGYGLPMYSDLESKNSVEQEIWRGVNERSQTSSLRLALLAPDDAQGAMLALELTDLGHVVHHFNVVDTMLSSIVSSSDKWDLLAIDIDLMEDDLDSVDEMIEFRKACPRVSVLLISGRTTNNDFSSERSAICDATLCKPVGHTQISKGITAALENFSVRNTGSL